MDPLFKSKVLDYRNPRPVLEIWYGSGSNGKTTLHRELVSMGTSISSPEIDSIIPIRWTQVGNLKVGYIVGGHEIDNGSLISLLIGISDPWNTRIIYECNRLPPLNQDLVRDFTKIFRFRQRF